MLGGSSGTGQRLGCNNGWWPECGNLLGPLLLRLGKRTVLPSCVVISFMS